MITVLHVSRGTSTIAFDPAVPCIIDTIDESLFNEELKNHINKALEFFIEKKIVYGKIGWLANMEAVKAILTDDNKWFFEDWTPRAAQAGLMYIATILPNDMITQIAFFDNPNEFENGIVCKFFPNIESAKIWLSECLIN